MALLREFTFAQDAFVQVRLKELNYEIQKPSFKDGFIFLYYKPYDIEYDK